MKVLHTLEHFVAFTSTISKWYHTAKTLWLPGDSIMARAVRPLGWLWLMALCWAGSSPAAVRASDSAAKVYVILWFDTEDYILPASDDAALRVAEFLTGEKIRATFKVVGEK